MMYARQGGKRSVEDAATIPIEDVVSEMPAEKLDWAMQQVANTLRKVNRIDAAAEADMHESEASGIEDTL
jgi:hypothetical protein